MRLGLLRCVGVTAHALVLVVVSYNRTEQA
jgi:hypothetical protein